MMYLSDFPAPKGGVLALPVSCNLATAVASLNEYGISSAPVIDDTQGDTFYGFLDYSAVVLQVLNLLNSIFPHDTESFVATLHHQAFAKMTVQELALTDENCVVLRRDNTVVDAMRVMTKYKFHRVAVLGDDDRLFNVITQSQISAAVLKSYATDLYKHVLDAPISTLGLGRPKALVTVTEADPLIRSLEEMTSNRLTSVGVVNREGALVGTLSAKDLSALVDHPEVFCQARKGNITVGGFTTLLTRFSQEAADNMPPDEMAESAVAGGGAVGGGVLCCEPEDVLGSVVCTLLQHHVHRLFVINNPKDRLPVSVVSYTDVVEVLLTCSEGAAAQAAAVAATGVPVKGAAGGGGGGVAVLQQPHVSRGPPP